MLATSPLVEAGSFGVLLAQHVEGQLADLHVGHVGGVGDEAQEGVVNSAPGNEEGSTVAAQEAALNLQPHSLKGEAGRVGDELVASMVGAPGWGAVVARGEEEDGQESEDLEPWHRMDEPGQ